MQQEIKVELVISGINVQVGHKFLEGIASNIPDIPDNKKVFELLAHSSNSAVRETIAGNEHLTLKTIEKLLEDETDYVVVNLVGNANVCKLLTDEHIALLLEKNNSKVLCELARNIDDMANADTWSIIEKLLQHENSSVRYKVLRNRFYDEMISPKLLKQLAQDEDIDVARTAKEKLKN